MHPILTKSTNHLELITKVLLRFEISCAKKKNLSFVLGPTCRFVKRKLVISPGENSNLVDTGTISLNPGVIDCNCKYYTYFSLPKKRIFRGKKQQR